MRSTCLPFLLFAGAVTAQSGLEPGTTLWVEPGTTITFQGSQTFSLPTGASVTNDGLMAFGAQATLNEAVGSPITGLGTETTTRSFAAPLAGVEPAGLGLQLSTTLAPGDLSITRGHLPFTDNGGLHTVKRWFNADPDVNSGLDAEVSFRVDPTELNGLPEANLILHTQGAGNYWTYHPGTVDLPGHSVIAPGLDSLGTLSLFAEISTGIQDPATTPPGSAMWLNDHLLIVEIPSPVSDRVDLLDAMGRVIASTTLRGGRASFDLTERSCGAYIVRYGPFSTRIARP